MDVSQDPQYKTADGSALRIWRDTAKNNYLSEKLGRPLFDECIYVEVISPGSRDSTPVFEVVRSFCPEMNYTDNDGILYGMKYEEYKSFILDFEKNEATDASLAGTPLAQWPEMARAMVSSLKAQNIFTVDALAALPDTRLTVVGPDGRAWRAKAQAYVEMAKNNAYATTIAADLERANADKAELKAQVSELAAQVAALQAAAAGQTPAKAPKAAQAAPVAPVVDPLASTDTNPVEPGPQTAPSII